VKVYLGQTRSIDLIGRLAELGFGELCCRGELPPRRLPFAYDNGAFKDWTADRPFNLVRYERDLRWMAYNDCLPDFICAPDVVGQGRESLDWSLFCTGPEGEFVPDALRDRVYLVVQNGMSERLLAPHLDVFAGIFVGGTLEWKLETGEEWVKLAHRRGLRCHVGRVGTEERVRWARYIGVDSIDSALPLWSEENLARFCRGLED